MPIPAIPNPLTIYSKNNSHNDAIIPEDKSIKGTKNKESIMLVLTNIVALPFLLILLVLKYILTLLLKVFEKSLSVALENLGFMVLFILLISTITTLKT
jgi:hypothetical protein